MKKHKNIYHNASLFRKALTDDLDDPAQKEFDELIKDVRMQNLFEELSDGQKLKKELDEMEQFSADRAYEQFCSRQKKSRRLIYRFTSLAIACMLVLGFGLWLYRSDFLREDSPATEVLAVAPGSNQAKLILGNGKEVLLGEGKAGNIQEEGADITCENGELKYRRQENSKETVFNELQVPMGGECTITLDDGTKVWVNADSQLKYPVTFNDKIREVTLNGEAYFEVKKDSRPFIVKTSYNQVKVLGTSFGVTAYGNDGVSYTTLVTGKVAVKNGQKQELEIKPGEQVVAHTDGKMLKREVNVDDYVGWKSGKYHFRNQKLGIIMNTLQRWYDISIEFKDEKMKDILFTGKLNRYDNLNLFLDALKATGELSYKKEGKTLILYKN